MVDLCKQHAGYTELPLRKDHSPNSRGSISTEASFPELCRMAFQQFGRVMCVVSMRTVQCLYPVFYRQPFLKAPGLSTVILGSDKEHKMPRTPLKMEF